MFSTKTVHEEIDVSAHFVDGDTVAHRDLSGEVGKVGLPLYSTTHLGTDAVQLPGLSRLEIDDQHTAIDLTRHHVPAEPEQQRIVAFRHARYYIIHRSREPATMYQLRHYLDMMCDAHRMEPLEKAIRNAVRPGDVVLDLGAGAGTLSFIALDAGAAHVYAIERSSIVDVARKIARDNGLSERMTFFQADGRAVTPPRQVDGLLGDVRGALPLLEDNIDLFQQVRERWLRPGGYTVPLQDELIVAPVAAPLPRHMVDGWRIQRKEAHYDAAAAMAANDLVRVSLADGDTLAPGQALGTVRYDGITAKKLTLETRFRVERTDELTGLGIWFRSLLGPGITFDSAPFSPPSVYGQAFLPLFQARPVAADETIEVAISVHRLPSGPIWSWSAAGGHPDRWHESHSTLKSTPIDAELLSWSTSSRTPSLSPDGLVARALLAAIDGKATVGDLAARLAKDFPDRFASPDQAIAPIMKILGRYGLR